MILEDDRERRETYEKIQRLPIQNLFNEHKNNNSFFLLICYLNSFIN